MPSYDYECELEEKDGGHGIFEEYHSMSDAAKLTECPLCRKEKDIHTPVHRLISGGSGRGIVQLEGQDFVASVKQDAQRIKKETYADPYKYANILGEDKYESLQRKIDKGR